MGLQIDQKKQVDLLWEKTGITNVSPTEHDLG